MTDRNFAATLIDLCQGAMARPERETPAAFLKFFALIALVAAVPLAVAILLNHRVVSGLADECWVDQATQGCVVETQIPQEYHALEGRIGSVAVTLELHKRKAAPPDPAENASGGTDAPAKDKATGTAATPPERPAEIAETAKEPLDPLAEHARYRAQVVFASALIFFWLFAGGVIGAQTYSSYRYWRRLLFPLQRRRL